MGGVPRLYPAIPPRLFITLVPNAGLSSPHDQIRPLAHVVAALSRPAPCHVPGRAPLDLVAKNNPRLALRRSLLRLLRVVLFRLHSLIHIRRASTLSRHHARRGAPFKPSSGLSGALPAGTPSKPYFRSESSTASAC